MCNHHHYLWVVRLAVVLVHYSRVLCPVALGRSNFGYFGARHDSRFQHSFTDEVLEAVRVKEQWLTTYFEDYSVHPHCFLSPTLTTVQKTRYSSPWIRLYFLQCIDAHRNCRSLPVYSVCIMHQVRVLDVNWLASSHLRPSGNGMRNGRPFFLPTCRFDSFKLSS